MRKADPAAASNEGKVAAEGDAIALSTDSKQAAIIDKCETDFVSGSDDLKGLLIVWLMQRLQHKCRCCSNNGLRRCC